MFYDWSSVWHSSPIIVANQGNFKQEREAYHETFKVSWQLGGLPCMLLKFSLCNWEATFHGTFRFGKNSDDQGEGNVG